MKTLVLLRLFFFSTMFLLCILCIILDVYALYLLLGVYLRSPELALRLYGQFLIVVLVGVVIYYGYTRRLILRSIFGKLQRLFQ